MSVQFQPNSQVSFQSRIPKIPLNRMMKKPLPDKLPDSIKNIDNSKNINLNSSFLSKLVEKVKYCNNFFKTKFSELRISIKNKFAIKDAAPRKVSEVARVIKPNPRKFKKGLKSYMGGLQPGEKVDPAKLEELLIKSGARDVTATEGIKFIPTAEYPVGKKKKFILGDKSYILETHNGSTGSTDTITRLYTEGAKNQREYLTSKGTFESGKYYSPFCHLFSGMKGQNWIKS